MYDVTTIGGAIRDFTFYIQKGEVVDGHFRFPVDSKTLVKEAYFTNGGGAQNVAIGLARFGLKVAAISRVGKDLSGQIIINNLKKDKVNTKQIQIDPSVHTGVSVIVQKRGRGKMLFTFRGASDNLTLDARYPMPDTRWFYIASLTGGWEKILHKIHLESRIKHPVSKIVWNPVPLNLWQDKRAWQNF